MNTVDLKQLVIDDEFVVLDEKCLIATDGGCGGGGSITEGIHFKLPGKCGSVYW